MEQQRLQLAVAQRLEVETRRWVVMTTVTAPTLLTAPLPLRRIQTLLLLSMDYGPNLLTGVMLSCESVSVARFWHGRFALLCPQCMSFPSVGTLTSKFAASVPLLYSKKLTWGVKGVQCGRLSVTLERRHHV